MPPAYRLAYFSSALGSLPFRCPLNGSEYNPNRECDCAVLGSPQNEPHGPSRVLGAILLHVAQRERHVHRMGEGRQQKTDSGTR